MYGRVARPLLDFSERGLGTRLVWCLYVAWFVRCGCFSNLRPVLSVCSVFLAIALEKGRKTAVSHEPRNVLTPDLYCYVCEDLYSSAMLTL